MLGSDCDALVGAALGDALAMPVDGLSHQNVRFFYKGIKGLTPSEQFGTPAGYGTRRTEALLALQRGEALPEEVTGAARTVVVALGNLSGSFEPDRLASNERVAAHLVRFALAHAASRPFDRDGFWNDLVEASQRLDTSSPVTARMQRLAGKLDRFPLDLNDLCNGAGDRPDEAVPFALAMFVRNPDVPEATLLSAINAGGDTATVGMLVGALLAARHGLGVFPADWLDGLAARTELDALCR